MKNTIVIGEKEATWFIINMICAKIVLNAIHILEDSAGSAGWILSIYLVILAVIGFYIVLKLFKIFPGKDIIDIGTEIGNSFGRIVMGLIFILSQLFVIVLYFRGFLEHSKIVSLNVSPISFIATFFILCMITACFFGLESIVRLHYLWIPIIFTILIVILLLTLPQCQFLSLFPLFGLGTDKIFINGALKLSIYQEVIFLFLLPPFLVSFDKFKSVGYKAIAFSGFLYTISVLFFGLLFPYPSATEAMFPIFDTARILSLGRLFQRLESFFSIIWIMTAIFFLSSSMYFIIYAFTKTFKLPYIKPLIIPTAILILNLTLLPSSVFISAKIVTDYYYSYSWIPTFALPFILLTICIIFRKGGKQNA